MSFLKTVLSVALLYPLFGFAQVNDESSSSRSEEHSQQATTEEPAQATSKVQFRGFRSADEDLPVMTQNWKLSFFQLAATEPARFDDDKAAGFFFYNYFSFNYKIDDESRFAIRPVFELESPGVNKYDESVPQWNAKWGDWYAQYSKFDLFEIGPFGTRMNLRLYAPTSEPSKVNGMITQFHPEFFMETNLRRGTSLEIAFKGDYYVQSKRAYSFNTESGKTIYTTNKQAELESYVELNQKISSKFRVKPRLTWFDTWKLRSPVNNLSSSHVTSFSPSIGIEWRPTENFNTTLSYANETQFYANRSFIHNDKAFDPNNSQLVALTNYRF